MKTPQNVTVGPSEDGAEEAIAKLSIPQQKAIERLTLGDTVTAAALAAGVRRETVHRWAREDWAFVAALNRARAELRDAADRRLLSAARTAADRVSEAVESGSFPAALAVLRGLGFLAGKFPQIGSDDPAALAEDAAVVQTEKASQLALRRMLSSGFGA